MISSKIGVAAGVRALAPEEAGQSNTAGLS